MAGSNIRPHLNFTLPISGSRLQPPRVPSFLARAAAGDGNQEKMQAMKEAIQNPEVMKAVQEQMQQPEVQQQMQQMSAMMQNQQFMAKAAALKDDPDLKPMFDEIKTGGMAAMMKYMNDPAFLAKIGEKMGDIEEVAGSQQPQVDTPDEPEILSILDAARYGDLEAIEDFIAIGKVDSTDDKGRTALHYAVAYDQGPSALLLLENGVDVNAQDSAGNTSLHFAAGYGRLSAVQALLSVGADVGIKNNENQMALELIKAEPRNPLNQNDIILQQLQS